MTILFEGPAAIPDGAEARLGLGVHGLTDGEVEVLHLMALGYSNYGIAGELWLATKTVEHRVSTVFLKLGLVDPDAVRNRRVMAVRRFLYAENSTT